MERCNSLGFVWLFLSAWISCCAAFYLPGLAPVSYCEPGKQSSNPACVVSLESFEIYFSMSVYNVIFRTL